MSSLHSPPPGSLNIVRRLTRWEIIAACLGFSAGLLAIPDLREMFPNLLQNSIIALGAFIISLISFGITKFLQQNYRESDIYKASLILTFSLLVMGLFSLLLISIEFAGRFNQITSIVGASISGTIMMLFIMRTSRVMQVATQQKRNVTPAGWLKVLSLCMAAMLTMLITVNFATQAFIGMPFFPLPDNVRVPLMIIISLISYGIISISETYINAVAAYINKRIPQPSQGK